MAISEIGVTFPDDSFGKESRFGTPFTVSSRQCGTQELVLGIQLHDLPVFGMHGLVMQGWKFLLRNHAYAG